LRVQISNCRGENQDVGLNLGQSGNLSWREKFSSKEPSISKLFKSRSERGTKAGRESPLSAEIG
jgi:hypothetical protein